MHGSGWGRCVLLVLMGWWGLSVWRAPMTEPPPLLHLTVILFHEAGHVIFAPFGEVIRVAGGTLGQLLMPLICAHSLRRHGDRFGAALCLAWAAMSLMDCAYYAWDAADPILPLIGGGTGADSFHDFIFLFEHWGQQAHAHAWARAMRALSGLGMALGLGRAVAVAQPG
jgi:hypothetical protein